MVVKWVQRGVVGFIAFCIAAIIYYNVVVTKDFDIEAPVEYPRGKKRIALCISGQIRPTWKTTLPTIKKYIIDAYHTDVFVSFDEAVLPADRRDILSLLHPIRYAFEEFTPVSANMYSKNYGLMMKRIISCNNMKKDVETQQGFTYDVVIRIRPDIFMKDSTPIESIDNIAENTLYSYDCKYLKGTVAYLGLSDQYFLGTSATLDKILVPDAIYKIDQMYTCKLSEYILRTYAIALGIKIEVFYSASLLYKMINTNMISYGLDFFKGIGYTATPPAFICDALNSMAN